MLIAAAGHALRRETATLEENRTSHLAVELDAGFAVHGTVALADGTPVPRAGVHVQQQDIGDQDLYSLFTETDGEGNYVLDHVPPGPAVLVAYQREPRLRAQTRLIGRAGDHLTWNVMFGTGPSIRGRARDESGQALVRWSVQAMPERGSAATLSSLVRTDERGEFVIPDLAGAAYTIHLFAPEDEYESMPRARAEGVFPDGVEVELVVHGERAPSASLLGRVLDPDGKPVRPKQIWARRMDDLHSVGNPTWSEGERFRIGPLLAGEYDLCMTIELGSPSFNREFVIAEDEEHDLGDLQLPRTGDACLTLHGPDGGPLAQTAVVCLTEGRFAHVLTSSDGLVFESGPLWPGAYWLRALSGSAAPDQRVSVEIRPDETTFGEARLAAGRTVVFDFQVPENERFPRELGLEVRIQAGALAFAQDRCKPQSVAGHEILMVVSALPLGHFAYSVRCEEGWSAAGELEVVPGSEAQLRVTVPLLRAR